jgi:putative peptidoglycan lipid II flippase
VLAGALVLVVVLAVMMGAARGPLTAALGALRAPDRQEVHRG